MKHTEKLEERIINEVQDRINSEHIDNDNEISEEEFNEIVNDNVWQEIDTYLIYYKDQMEVVKELQLYDWSHFGTCNTIGEVAYWGLEEEIMNRGKVTDINNYKFKTNDN